MDERKIWYRQFLCVIPMSCIYFMLGLGRGWIAPILSQVNDADSELPLTSEESSWMASLSYLSRSLGPILISFFLNKISRSSFSLINATILFVMWIAVYWSRDVHLHYLIRLVFGLCDGLHVTLSSVYICENCSPQYRGTFATMIMTFLFAGHVVVFVLASFCSYNGIALAFSEFGLLTLLSTFLLVEPPQYLLLRGNEKKARENFRQLRSTEDPAISKEFEAIKKNIEEERNRKFDLKLYRSKEIVRSLRVVLIVSFMVGECGYPVVSAFVTKLLLDSDSTSANRLSIIYGLLQLISVGASSAIIDRFNRRTLHLVSSASTTIIHAGIVALYCLQSMFGFQCFNILLFTLLTMFSCVSSMFIFPLMSLLRGELLPQSIKMVGIGLATASMSLSSFLDTRTFLPVTEAFSIEFNFVIFSAFAVILAVYVYFDLPETRGKTLVEIQNELKGVKDDRIANQST